VTGIFTKSSVDRVGLHTLAKAKDLGTLGGQSSSLAQDETMNWQLKSTRKRLDMISIPDAWKY